MIQWSFIVTDGRPASSGGGHLVSYAAPYTNVKWSDGLDQGNLTCSFPLDSVPAVDRLSYCDEDRTVIWPCVNGTPVGAWIVTSQQPRTLGQDTVDLVAQPALWRILDSRIVRSTLVFNQVDQLDIARDLIRYATNQATTSAQFQPVPKGVRYEVPWLRFGTNLSTRPPRDRLDNTDGWQAASRKTIGQCLRSLIELIDGFEVLTVAGLDDTRMPYLEARFGDPEVSPAAPIGRLEWPSAAVTAGTHGRDGSERATLVDVIGAAQEPVAALIATAVDDLAAARRMPREVAVNGGTISLYATLLARAQGELAVNGPAQTGFSLTVGSMPPVEPYSFIWGSRFTLAVEDAGFPDGAEFTVRARGAQVEVGGFGQADTVKLDLQVEGAQ
jgi:hypothetical protein